ncbi:MAG: hypothetical protein ACI4BD_05130 [Paludibacteraceae bacterium]
MLILNKSTFFGRYFPADDPRQTRGRPAKNIRDGGEGGNLNNRTILWIFPFRHGPVGDIGQGTRKEGDMSAP